MKKTILLVLIVWSLSFTGLFAQESLEYIPLEPEFLGLAEGQAAPDVPTYLTTLYSTFFLLIIVFAVLFIIIGGIEYIGSGRPGAKSDGKQKIMAAIFGLLIALSSWLILNTINPALLEFNFLDGETQDGGGEGGDSGGEDGGDPPTEGEIASQEWQARTSLEGKYSFADEPPCDSSNEESMEESIADGDCTLKVRSIVNNNTNLLLSTLGENRGGLLNITAISGGGNYIELDYDDVLASYLNNLTPDSNNLQCENEAGGDGFYNCTYSSGSFKYKISGNSIIIENLGSDTYDPSGEVFGYGRCGEMESNEFDVREGSWANLGFPLNDGGVCVRETFREGETNNQCGTYVAKLNSTTINKLVSLRFRCINYYTGQGEVNAQNMCDFKISGASEPECHTGPKHGQGKAIDLQISGSPHLEQFMQNKEIIDCGLTMSQLDNETPRNCNEYGVRYIYEPNKNHWHFDIP